MKNFSAKLANKNLILTNGLFLCRHKISRIKQIRMRYIHKRASTYWSFAAQLLEIFVCHYYSNLIQLAINAGIKFINNSQLVYKLLYNIALDPATSGYLIHFYTFIC